MAAAGTTGAAALPATTALPGMAMRGGAGRIAAFSLAPGRWAARELTAARAAAMSPMSTRPRYAAPASIIKREIAHHARRRHQFHTLRSDDGADHRAGNHDLADIHVSLDRGPLLDGEILRELHPAVDATTDDEILIAAYLARNSCIRTNDSFLVSHGARLYVHVHVALEPGTVGNHDAW